MKIDGTALVIGSSASLVIDGVAVHIWIGNQCASCHALTLLAGWNVVEEVEVLVGLGTLGSTISWLSESSSLSLDLVIRPTIPTSPTLSVLWRVQAESVDIRILVYWAIRARR